MESQRRSNVWQGQSRNANLLCSILQALELRKLMHRLGPSYKAVIFTASTFEAHALLKSLRAGGESLDW